jgi:hypothetical protein
MAFREQVACVGATFIIIHKHYENKIKDRNKRRWWVRQLLQRRKLIVVSVSFWINTQVICLIIFWFFNQTSKRGRF